MSTYSRASKAAWYEDRYLGAVIEPNVGVIHTTEGTSLPGYNGGASAPNYTALPDFRRKRLKWFVHFSDERSSRALRNLAGGVETNTLNALQVELVGTCDPATSRAWSKAGRRHIFWPNAPLWALRDVGHFVADMAERHKIKVKGPELWAPYPSSYANGAGQRFDFGQWRNFYGWCGHQHVPENTHGDPGNLPWGRISAYALEYLNGGTAPKPPKKTPRWDRVFEQADQFQDSLPARAKARRKTLEEIKQLAARWSVRY